MSGTRKHNPFVPRAPVTREEALKRALRKELMDEIRRDGRTRDEVRRVLDALPPWTPFQDVTAQLSSPMARAMGITDPKVLLAVQTAAGTGNAGTRVFENSRYVVHRTPTRDGGFMLSIRTAQNDTRHDWREFQRIKNELCGPEFEGLELYPAESRLVDSANQYYVHVLPPGMDVPVGFHDRLVIRPRPPGDPTGTNQRPWEPGTEPPDAIDVSSTVAERALYEKVLRDLRNKETASVEDPEPEGDRRDLAAEPHADREPSVRQGPLGGDLAEQDAGGQGGKGEGAGRQAGGEVPGPAPEGGRQVQREYDGYPD